MMSIHWPVCSNTFSFDLVFTCKVVYKKVWRFVHICKSYCETTSGAFLVWTRCDSNDSTVG